jgi:hypothetical protein
MSLRFKSRCFVVALLTVLTFPTFSLAEDQNTTRYSNRLNIMDVLDTSKTRFDYRGTIYTDPFKLGLEHRVDYDNTLNKQSFINTKANVALVIYKGLYVINQYEMTTINKAKTGTTTGNDLLGLGYEFNKKFGELIWNQDIRYFINESSSNGTRLTTSTRLKYNRWQLRNRTITDFEGNHVMNSEKIALGFKIFSIKNIDIYAMGENEFNTDRPNATRFGVQFNF